MYNQIAGQFEGAAGAEYGAMPMGSIDALNKALTAGQDINAPSVAAGEGFPMRVESLERTLKNTTYKMSHVRFWRNVPKMGASNTVEEHNEISSYGENPDAGWIDEIDLPREDDSTYERKYSVIKYLGTTRRVSHVMSLVKPAHGNQIARETVNGTMHLLRIIERALFFARSDLSSLQFDGFEKLMEDAATASTNVIDLRGAPLSEDILTDAALIAQDAPNYGQINKMYCNPKIKADLVKTFFPKERHDTLQKTGDGLVGLDIRGFTSPAGDVIIEPDVFLTDGGAPTPAVGEAAKRPGTPSITAAASTPPAALSQFGDDDAGDYRYKVQAVNRYGRSVAIDVDAGAIAILAGDEMTFGITPGGGEATEWYELYRTKVNGAAGTERQILRIPNTAGAGQLTVHDYNASLPGAYSVFLFQEDMESMSVKQLSTMIKVPLAIIDTSVRWMQLCYMTPVLYTPGKNVLLKNVGRASGSLGV